MVGSGDALTLTLSQGERGCLVHLTTGVDRATDRRVVSLLTFSLKREKVRRGNR